MAGAGLGVVLGVVVRVAIATAPGSGDPCEMAKARVCRAPFAGMSRIRFQGYDLTRNACGSDAPGGIELYRVGGGDASRPAWLAARYNRRYCYAMRPLRYSINVTLDGCCDHRAGIPDDELHRHAIENL